jgi:hypothetical protein
MNADTDDKVGQDQPEQFAHGIKGLTTAQVGTVIDTGPATITQILYTGAPSSYEVPTFDPTGLPLTAYFCLVDQGPPSRVLFNYNGHINGGHSPHATHKMSGYTIPYTGNLVLQSCPAGAVYSLTTA